MVRMGTWRDIYHKAPGRGLQRDPRTASKQPLHSTTCEYVCSKGSKMKLKAISVSV